MNDSKRKRIMKKSRQIQEKMAHVMRTINEIPTDTPETDALAFPPLNHEPAPIPAWGRIIDLEQGRKLERERDKYAGLLCEAMSYAYGWPNQGPNVSALISAFEALELTPANGSC